ATGSDKEEAARRGAEIGGEVVPGHQRSDFDRPLGGGVPNEFGKFRIVDHWVIALHVVELEGRAVRCGDAVQGAGQHAAGPLSNSLVERADGAAEVYVIWDHVVGASTSDARYRDVDILEWRGVARYHVLQASHGLCGRRDGIDQLVRRRGMA